MKPPFALSLSFDGIRLLHRAAGGWRVVGAVALDTEDMSADLAALRDAAGQLESAAPLTKLLLPNEQIKYLTISTPQMSEAARRGAAIEALDGATPYKVSDLAFDISLDGDETHIAAVAHETLAEAETFALEHRFKPVCFAAIPGDHAYLGEPYFGPTATAANVLAPGDVAEPDGIAVVIIGETGTAAPAPKQEQEVSEPEETALPEVSVAEPEVIPAEPETVDALIAVSDATLPLDDADTATLVRPAAETPASTPAAPKPVNAGSIIDPLPPMAAPIPDIDTPRTETPPGVGFASRRLQDKKAPPAPSAPKRRTEPTLTRAVPRDSEPPVPTDLVARLTATPSPLPEPDPKPPRRGLLNGRRGEAKPKAAAKAVAAKNPAERDRMTVFGARQAQIGGKPRFLGLILTTALLVLLAGVAAWASVYLDEGRSLSRLFGERQPQVAALEIPELETPALATPEISQPEAVLPDVALPQVPPNAPEEVQTASLDPSLSDEDGAVLDALSEPVEPEVLPAPGQFDVEAKYAADGIWSRAPVVPPAPAALVNLDDLYLASIDPVSTTTDAVAMPSTASFETDVVLTEITSPVPAGTRFALDAQGDVIPTVEGALSPAGFTVYLGRPPIVPPATPNRFQTPPEDTAILSALAAFRPQSRPADLQETTQRAQLDGLTRTELAAIRPALRPPSAQQQAEAAAAPAPVDTDAAVTAALAVVPPDPIASATRLAAAASLRPDTRPNNFSRTVQRAQRAAPQEETRVASAAAIAPRSVVPKIPSNASVSRAATTRNAINLRDVNLIGVYGKPSSRRALIRLSNGRYKKVVVGDRIDGGVVSAIGEGELRYTKRGRNLVLKMPR